MAVSVKITSKGQVTIPKEIRRFLKTDVVTFDVVEGTVVVKPVHDVGAALSDYARNIKPDTPFKKVKDKAWEEAVREKIRRTSP